jgi:hypothetical protein
MYRSCSNSRYHLVWCGRIAAWSMSGFVTTTCPAVRVADRMGAGVSPSYVDACTSSPDAEASPRSAATWSWPRALVGKRKSARADGSSASDWRTGIS